MNLAPKVSLIIARLELSLPIVAVMTCGLLASSGCSSGTSSSSTPASKAPFASAGGPYMALPGAAVVFSGAASADPQSSDLTYAWNFGDKSTGTGIAPKHAYAGVGNYTVSVTATDALGLSATANTIVTVAAQAPAANAGGPYTSSVGSPVNFDGSGSVDPQGQTLTYAWDFGDGTMGSGAQQTHLYSTHGAYTATLTVTDAIYNLTGTSSASVVNAQVAIQPMANVVPKTDVGYFSDPYPIQTVVPNGSPVPSFVGTTGKILTCPAALQSGCFIAAPNAIDAGPLAQQANTVGTTIKSFENLNSYQDSKGTWQMAATAFVVSPTKNWTVIVHAHPRTPYTGIPAAWVADTLLVGSLSTFDFDNYDGKYFEDSGVLYLLYNKKLSPTKTGEGVVAQAMLSASQTDTSAPVVPLLGPEESDVGYRSELSSNLDTPNPVKLIETGNVTKIQGKYVMAYSTGVYNMPNYKAGLAWSDSFLPQPNTYYKRVQKIDVAGVWGTPNHAEVAYLLQAQQPQWPNYVASQVLSPGVPSVVVDTSGNYHLFFAGYDPSDVLSPAPSGGYNGALRRPYYVDLEVNIPGGTTVIDASPIDMANWIQPVTTP